MAHLDVMRAQLIAVRAMVDAMLLALGTPETPEECPHPEEDRRPAGTMGSPHRFYCTRCDTLVGDENDGTVPIP